MGLYVFLFLIVAQATFFVFVNRLIGAKRKPSPLKDEAFECGSEKTAPLPERIPISFYPYLIIFLILDIELVFFLPYAVVVREGGWHLFLVMMLFTLFIATGFLYIWKETRLEYWQATSPKPLAVPGKANHKGEGAHVSTRT